MSLARGLCFALLGSLLLSFALWPGSTSAEPTPRVDMSDCRVTVRHSMGEHHLEWEERYFATMTCGSDKPEADGEMRFLSVGSSRQGSIFAGGDSCSVEEASEMGVTYPCVIETSAFCIGNETTRYPVARLIVNRGRGFKVVASARSSLMSLDCRSRVGRFFDVHLEVWAVEGREVADPSVRERSG
jgi:hypothetical protein